MDRVLDAAIRDVTLWRIGSNYEPMQVLKSAPFTCDQEYCIIFRKERIVVPRKTELSDQAPMFLISGAFSFSDARRN